MTGGDGWWPFEGWGRFADVATAFTIIGAVGVFLLAWQIFAQKRQWSVEFASQDRQREEAAYQAITAQYNDLLRLCFEHPGLAVARLIEGEPVPPPAVGDEDDARAQRTRDRVAFEMLFEAIEKAFVLYRADDAYLTRESGSARAERRFVWKDLSNKDKVEDFRLRQWSGWDSWIRRDLDRHERFWVEWDNACSGDTYDNVFMQYMDHAKADPLPDLPES